MEEKIRRAKGLKNQKRWTEAIPLYQELVGEKPDNVNLLADLGWCQSRADKRHEAIETYRRLVELESDNPKWYYSLGYQHYIGEKEHRQAVDCFRKALELYPEYFVVKYRLAYSLLQVAGHRERTETSEFREALEHLEEARTTYQKMNAREQRSNRINYGKICYQLGKVYAELNQWDKALDCLGVCNETNPSEDSWYQTAKVLFRRGNIEEAFSVLPNSEKFYVKELKADILAALGKQSESIKILQEVASVRKKDYILRNVAEKFLAQGDFHAAYTWVNQAIVMKPDNHKNHLCLAQIYYNLGLLEKAKQSAEWAAELKLEGYGYAYSEAYELLETIENEINALDYLGDDEKILRSLGIREGRISKINGDRGFGFIQSGSESFFFHFSVVDAEKQSELKEGAQVKFEWKLGNKGPMATNLELV